MTYINIYPDNKEGIQDNKGENSQNTKWKNVTGLENFVKKKYLFLNSQSNQMSEMQKEEGWGVTGQLGGFHPL